MNIKKAVIPAAGLGTRFLPVTKSYLMLTQALLRRGESCALEAR